MWCSVNVAVNPNSCMRWSATGVAAAIRGSGSQPAVPGRCVEPHQVVVRVIRRTAYGSSSYSGLILEAAAFSERPQCQAPLCDVESWLLYRHVGSQRRAGGRLRVRAPEGR